MCWLQTDTSGPGPVASCGGSHGCHTPVVRQHSASSCRVRVRGLPWALASAHQLQPSTLWRPLPGLLQFPGPAPWLVALPCPQPAPSLPLPPLCTLPWALVVPRATDNWVILLKVSWLVPLTLPLGFSLATSHNMQWSSLVSTGLWLWGSSWTSESLVTPHSICTGPVHVRHMPRMISG